jgi:M6 family metalloprotease-like protein
MGQILRMTPGADWAATAVERRLLLAGGAFSFAQRMAPMLTICATLLIIWSAHPAAARPHQDAGVVRGDTHALAVFACFNGEMSGGSDAIPAFGPDLFDASVPGSLSHYFLEMSRGQFALSGGVLATWLTAPGQEAAYVPPAGNYASFVADILTELDGRLDLGEYDNDGPDGLPNSGDDDGYVDFLFVTTLSAPLDFIAESATGIAGLGLVQDYVSADGARGGGTVRVRADSHSQGAGGVLQRGHTYEVAVGSMAHEFAHFLGLVDLYSLRHLLDPSIAPSEDSAGIGYWGLMGHGSRGWNERGGPNPMSAWSLRRLGWLGRNNSQLEVVSADMDTAFLADVNAGGKVYQLPIRQLPDRGHEEYLLVECRMRGNSYYERNLPAEGVLIWHVHEDRRNNDYERAKRVDLVCADGLFADAGHGRGRDAAPFDGGDNLDFWAHDATYARSYGGNLGDATDLFDGVRHTDYWLLTNPAGPAGVSVTGISPSGDGFVARIRVADKRRAGPITRDETWSGEIHVVGDVTVEAQARLTLSAGVVVRFGADGLRSGEDAERSELIIQGLLSAHGGGRSPIRLTSAAEKPAPGDWYGLRWRGSGVQALSSMVIEFPYVGISADQPGLALDLRDLVIRAAAADGLRLRRYDRRLILDGVQVNGSGGFGAVIHGSGLTRAIYVRMADNASGGLLRIGGALDVKSSRFAGNGAAADTAANLTLGPNAFGTIESTDLVGAVGIRCVATKDVVITGNSFTDNRVGVVSLSSRPRISSNTFSRSGLVLLAEGFAVPGRVDLNIVQAAVELVANRTSTPLTVANNWWGSVDPDWIGARMTGNIVWEPYLNFDPREGVTFRLAQSYPNPFSGTTVIDYAVGINEPVVVGRTRTVLQIRDITGSQVRKLVDTVAAPGVFQTAWDGRDQQGRRVASGVYYCELRVGPIVQRRRLLFLK